MSGEEFKNMCESLHRVIEAHHDSKNPFHSPINADAVIALRVLRGMSGIPDEITTLREKLAASEALAERMKIRADTFEAAYNVANRATFQPHNAHWDATGGSGKGCPACQAAREAREQCDDILRAGLQSIAELAEGEAG